MQGMSATYLGYEQTQLYISSDYCTVPHSKASESRHGLIIMQTTPPTIAGAQNRQETACPKGIKFVAVLGSEVVRLVCVFLA